MTARFLALLLLLAALLGMATLPAAAQNTTPAAGATATENDIDTAPVEIDGNVLFRVRGASSLVPETRARKIRDRIEAVAADRAIGADAVRAVESEGLTNIMAGDRPLLALTEADARLEQMERSDLARVHVFRIQQAITDYRAARAPDALRRGALESAGATVVLALVLALLVWAARRLDRLLAQRVQSRIRSLAVQSFEFVRAERIGAALRGALYMLQALVILAAVVAYLDFVLGQFPWTRSLSRGLLDLVLDPLATIGKAILTHIPNLVFLVILFYVFRFVVRIVRAFFDAVGRGAVTLSDFDPEWAGPTYRIVRFGIIAFGLVVAYPYIPGSDSDAFKGVSLFLGVLISIGSSSAIANIVAGYMLTYRRAFRVGDRVKIGDATGDVIQLRLQVTHLRSPKNEEIIVPNSQILNTEVVNYSSLARSQGLILHTEVGIGYETPWRQVEAMLLLAAERTPGLLREPAPFVFQTKLGDFAVTYQLNAYCDNASAMGHYYTDLHRNILDLFNEYGVQIMTPAYEGDTEQPKLVAKKDWFLAPAAPPSS